MMCSVSSSHTWARPVEFIDETSRDGVLNSSGGTGAGPLALAGPHKDERRLLRAG